MRPFFLKEWAGVGSKKKREVARHKLLLVLVHRSLLVRCKQLIFHFHTLQIDSEDQPIWPRRKMLS